MKQSLDTVRKRQQQILDYFSQKDSLGVSELSERLGVSELTIRRDFAYLEKKGLINRYHGGAQKIDNPDLKIINYSEKHAQHFETKRKIAEAVSELIKEQDTLFINGGTTTMEVIKLLSKKDLTIVTNHVEAFTFCNEGKAKLICTGGEYNPVTKSYSGLLATSFLDIIVAKVCILGVNGITMQEGITTAYYQETLVNEEFINRTKGSVIVVADGSKIGKTFGFSTAPIDKVTMIVTDSSADKQELEKLRSCGIKIVLIDSQETPS